MTRRGATTLVGILPIDKPAGMTSHDVVAVVRRATGEGRVGHAGTLDPMATGLLVVLVGAYTRLAPYLTAASKDYFATISFGSETDTDDADGATIRTAPVPSEILDPAYAGGVLASYVGKSSQLPPAYSAIKVDGQTAHRAARAGKPLDLQLREIDVSKATLLSIDPTRMSWDVSFSVSKGTYVRALARDIGRACGTAAHLSGLRRTASGHLTLTDAHTLDELAGSAAEGRIAGLFFDPLLALGLSSLRAPHDAIRFGAAFDAPTDIAVPEGQAVSVTSGGALAGIYRSKGGRLIPEVVLPGGAAA
ncbi:MAG TPA: tRNA pseudouridine(55) synthase TruB [Coriobacteriia bacterium]